MRIYLDSMVWIYYFENPTRLGDDARSMMHQFRRGHDVLLSSYHVFAETMVLPTRQKNSFLIAAYRQVLLSSDTVQVLTFTAETALRFAAIRATTTVQSLDAIHLALAATHGTDLFVTGDTQLHGLSVPGIGRIADVSRASNPAQNP